VKSYQYRNISVLLELRNPDTKRGKNHLLKAFSGLTLGCKIVAGSWKERTPCCTFPQKLWSIAQISNKLQHNYHQSHYFMAHLIILFLLMPVSHLEKLYNQLVSMPRRTYTRTRHTQTCSYRYPAFPFEVASIFCSHLCMTFFLDLCAFPGSNAGEL
jgi:hypothetical protein